MEYIHRGTAQQAASDEKGTMVKTIQLVNYAALQMNTI